MKNKKAHQRGNADGMVAESGEAVRFSDNGVETVIRKDGITITNRTGRELTVRLSAPSRPNPNDQQRRRPHEVY